MGVFWLQFHWGSCQHSFRQWASYQIRKIAGCACAGNAGNVFPRRRFQRKLLVSDPGMHHGTCVTHVPWCMSGSLTCGDGENVPGACAPAILRIWQEAHGLASNRQSMTWTKVDQDLWCHMMLLSHNELKGSVHNFGISFMTVMWLLMVYYQMAPDHMRSKWCLFHIKIHYNGSHNHW